MKTGKKYMLLNDDFVKLSDGTKLYRIMALRDILSSKLTVLAGQKGGFVESERNLSQKGDSWVCEGSIIRESAFVCGDAIIRGKSEVFGEAYISDSAIAKDCVICRNTVVADECVLDNCLLANNNKYTGKKIMTGVHLGDASEFAPQSKCDEMVASPSVMER